MSIFDYYTNLVKLLIKYGAEQGAEIYQKLREPETISWRTKTDEFVEEHCITRTSGSEGGVTIWHYQRDFKAKCGGFEERKDNISFTVDGYGRVLDVSYVEGEQVHTIPREQLSWEDKLTIKEVMAEAITRSGVQARG